MNIPNHHFVCELHFVHQQVEILERFCIKFQIMGAKPVQMAAYVHATVAEAFQLSNDPIEFLHLICFLAAQRSFGQLIEVGCDLVLELVCDFLAFY